MTRALAVNATVLPATHLVSMHRATCALAWNKTGFQFECARVYAPVVTLGGKFGSERELGTGGAAEVGKFEQEAVGAAAAAAAAALPRLVYPEPVG